jgi:hypothetical protein
MTGKKGSKIYWFLPSFAGVIFIIVLALILSGEGNLLGDADTGYHIRAGEYIIDNLKVPHHDMFSFIQPPIPWTAHEWLSEIIYALVHQGWGLSGIVVGHALVIATVFLLLFKFMRSSGISILLAALLVALAVSVSTIHWLARPHIFSFLFTLIWYVILDTYQYKKKNYLYVLPVLMIVWVNLHGGFLAGFLLFGIYITGNLLKAIFKREERQEARGRFRVLLLFTALTLGVSLLNPKGYDILLFPFRLTANKFIMDHVNEFLSPNFHTATRFEYMLLLMIVIFGISRLRLNPIEAMLVLLFTHMSLYSARYIPLYAIILCPIIGKRIDSLLEELREKRLVKRFLDLSERAARTDSLIRWDFWPLLAVVFSVFLLSTGRIEFGFAEKNLPVDAVKFIKKEKIPGRMFNNDEFGDYIIYAAWPEYKVFFDGRSDMYGVERMKEYFKVTRLETGWDEVLNEYDINWFMYPAKSALSTFLLQRDDWKLIYADRVANIFIKDTAENQYLIQKYPDVKPVIVDEEEEDDSD